MRFGLRPYDDDHEDSSGYTRLIGCEPEDNFDFYEKKEPKVGQSDEVSTTTATVKSLRISRVVLQSLPQAQNLVVAGKPLPGDTSTQRSYGRSRGLEPS